MDQAREPCGTDDRRRLEEARGPDLGPTRAKREWAALGVDGLGVANEAPPADAPRDFTPKLTNEMVARIQGWAGPEYAWDFADGKGRKTSTYRQIGNAFPPPVARAIGRSIAAALRKEGSPDGDHGTGNQYRDEVYRSLKDHGGFMSVAALRKSLGGTMDEGEIERRIHFIEKDFEVEVKKRGATVTYKLGPWRAFRGQDDHVRREAFSDNKLRAKIS